MLLAAIAVINAEHGITISKITDNPGILPIRLGNMQNIVDHWSFIRIFDIQPLRQKIVYYKEQYQKIMEIILNTTFERGFSAEVRNHIELLQFHLEETEHVLLQIIPKTQIRTKRGLING